MKTRFFANKVTEIRPYLPGAGLITLGLLFLLWPLFLVIVVSAALITAGIVAVSVVHRVKKIHREAGWVNEPCRIRVWRP